MNILFAIPSFPKQVEHYLVLPSMELCIMSSILKEQGHNVELFDMQINQYQIEDAEKLLSGRTIPDIVCIEDMPQLHCNTKLLIKAVRKVFPNSIIMLRGEIPSFIPQTMLERNDDLDFVLRYETDFAISKIIEKMNSNNDFSSIPNIAFRDKNNKIIITETKFPDYKLDILPPADRALYDLSLYLKRDSETIAKSSRGCVGNCAFCTKTRYENFRIFPMARFVEELKQLQDFGFRTFFFSDNVFAFSMDRLYEFEKELNKRNMKVKWTSNIRIKDITDEKIALMKKLGAYRIFTGIETINANSSKLINKNIEKNEILDKINILKKYNVEFHASFILGSPGDTEKDLEATIDFVRQIKPTLVTFNLLKVFPGLPIYDNPEKFGIIMPDKYWYEKDEWTKKVVMGTNELPPERLEYWSRRMLYEFMQ